MVVVKRIHLSGAVVLVLLALTAPGAAQDEPRAAGKMEPLGEQELEAAQIPLERDSDADEDESRDDWLRDRIFEEPGYFMPATPGESRQSSGSEGLSPFQRDFRDAITEQMRSSATQSR